LGAAIVSAADAAEQGNGAEAQDDGPDGRNDHDRAAAERCDYILLRGHSDNDRDIHSTPELDTESHAPAQTATANEPEAGGNEKNHGEPDAADVRLCTECHAQKIAEEDADQRADGEKSHTENDHAVISCSMTGKAAAWAE
jgi:hypothetical protein